MSNHPLLLAIFLALTLSLSAQSRQISGKITNQAGEPLPGATIMIKGLSQGTAAGSEGFYALEVPADRDVLLFQFLGYATQEVSIGNRTVIDIIMQDNANRLEEVIVVGFGTESRRRVTSAISQVDERVIKNVSVPAFQGALQGRLPGVVITNASGGLNAEPNIRIRGVGSISAGNQPLFVIDGLILSDETITELYGYRTNPLLNTDPNDIESIEVLKDAAAAAIYGSRGANGVILITTKSGQYNTRPKVSLGYYAGFSEISKRYDLLNGREYARLWNESARNAGYTEADGLFYDVEAQPSVDWQELNLQTGFVQEATAGVSGGTPSTRYYFGGTFRGEDGYLLTTGLQRYSVRTNIEQKLGSKVKVGLSLNPTRVVDRRAGNQWAGSAYGWATWYYPNVEAFDANGDIRRDVLSTEIGWGGFPGNPATVLRDQWVQTTTSQVLFNTHLTYEPWSNFQIKTELGSQFHQLEDLNRYGAATFFGGPAGSAGALNQQVFTYNWTTLATYRNSWSGGHSLDLSLGTHLTKESYNGFFTFAGNFPSDDLRYLGAAAEVYETYGWKTDNAFVGYLSRMNYSFRDRYLLTLAARYDGSSRFGTGNRYGFFPALSTGWIISNEDFFESNWLSFLKLRTSIGLAGNAEIGDFAARGLVRFNRDYDNQPGFIITSVENEDLGWEKSLQWDVGLEFSAWNGRLRGSLDYYIKDTKDLLLEVPVPATNGIQVLSENAGEVRNQGFEFDLTTDILRGDLGWTLAVNGATLRNEVRRLIDKDGDGQTEDIILNGRNLIRPGVSLGAFYLVEYAGVDPDNGDALFYDLEGNKVPNQAPAANRQIAGKPLPDFTGGFTNTFTFRGFELSAFFQFKTGHHIYLMHHQSIENNMSNGNNQLRNQLDAWTPDNRDSDIPQARLFEGNGNQVSTRYLQPADYLRLKNLTLSYTFDQLGNAPTRLRLFAAAQNLLTFTPFNGLDPDSEFYPAASAAQGGILYNLPAARTFTFGFNLDL